MVEKTVTITRTDYAADVDNKWIVEAGTHRTYHDSAEDALLMAAAIMRRIEEEQAKHETTSFGDLARGVRVFLMPDGTMREEPFVEDGEHGGAR